MESKKVNPITGIPNVGDRNNALEAVPQNYVAQLEYHISNAISGSSGLDAVLRDVVARAKDGMRSKLVLSFPVDAKMYREKCSSNESQECDSRSAFHDMLITKLENREPIFIERVAGSDPESLSDDEYHDILTTLRIADKKSNGNITEYIWLFVFENTLEEFINGKTDDGDKLTIAFDTLPHPE